MVITKDIEIKTSENSVVVEILNIRSSNKKFEVLRFSLSWGVFGILGIASSLGFVSPETLDETTRIFIVVFTLVWLIGGGMLLWRNFVQA